MKRLSLELGGHAPFIIFEDADLKGAVREVITSKFRNGGQTCVCANRIYIQESVREEFTRLFVDAVNSLVVGDPFSKQTQIGPMVNQQGFDKVNEHVNDALDKGAKALAGGKGMKNLFFLPTVLIDVNTDMKIMHEETFGPVAPLVTFSDEAEVIKLANNSQYGLSAYIWTDSLRRAHRVAEALEYGIIGVNDGLPSTAQVPFGGMKMSGLGREGGHWGIEEFLDIKYISMGLK